MSRTPEQRAELLAVADAGEVVALAERCLALGAAPAIVAEPEAGLVVLQVREPVAGTRFYLCEVLATRAEVAVDGVPGWAMRLGEDRAATLASAICDAEAEARRPLAAEVEALCDRAAEAEALQRAAQWRDVAPTIVQFEELDT
ncbi:MAG: phosphonate C-P lyase system protein PhnG [Egibacteraceae bacterium]